MTHRQENPFLEEDVGEGGFVPPRRSGQPPRGGNDNAGPFDPSRPPQRQQPVFQNDRPGFQDRNRDRDRDRDRDQNRPQQSPFLREDARPEARPEMRPDGRPANPAFDRGDRAQRPAEPVRAQPERAARPSQQAERPSQQAERPSQQAERPQATRIGQWEIAAYRSMREPGYLNREGLVRYRRHFTQAFAVLFTINSFIGMVYVCSSIQSTVTSSADWIAVVMGIVISVVLFLGQCVYADYDTGWERAGYVSLLIPDMATTAVFWHFGLLYPLITAFMGGVQGVDASLIATIISLPVSVFVGYFSSRFPEHAFFGKRIRGYLKGRPVSA